MRNGAIVRKGAGLVSAGLASAVFYLAKDPRALRALTERLHIRRSQRNLRRLSVTLGLLGAVAIVGIVLANDKMT